MKGITRWKSGRTGRVTYRDEDGNVVPAPTTDYKSFQQRVAIWAHDCFGAGVANDKPVRNFRFLEEALELVQALGCTKQEALQLVDYVYGRPAGEATQEVGGVRVTLSALCAANRIDEQAAAETELARINRPEIIAKIREKSANKPKFGPLPGPSESAIYTLPALTWPTLEIK